MQSGKMVKAIQAMGNPTKLSEKQVTEQLDAVYNSYPHLNDQARDEKGLAPIHAAVMCANPFAVKWLIGKGKNLDFYLLSHDEKALSSARSTALCLAVQYADVKKYIDNKDEKDQKESQQLINQRLCLNLMMQHRGEPAGFFTSDKDTPNQKQAALKACHANNIYYLDYLLNDFKKSSPPKDINTVLNLSVMLEIAVQKNYPRMVDYALEAAKTFAYPIEQEVNAFITQAINNSHPEIVSSLLKIAKARKNHFALDHHQQMTTAIEAYESNTDKQPALKIIQLLQENYISFPPSYAPVLLQKDYADSFALFMLTNGELNDNKASYESKTASYFSNAKRAWCYDKYFLTEAIENNSQKCVKLLLSTQAFDQECALIGLNLDDELQPSLTEAVRRRLPLLFIKQMLLIAANANKITSKRINSLLFKARKTRPTGYWDADKFSYPQDPKTCNYLTTLEEYLSEKESFAASLEKMKKEDRDHADFLLLTKAIEKAKFIHDEKMKEEAIAAAERDRVMLKELTRVAEIEQKRKQAELAKLAEFKKEIQQGLKEGLLLPQNTTSVSASALPKPSAPPLDVKELPSASAPSAAVISNPMASVELDIKPPAAPGGPGRDPAVKVLSTPAIANSESNVAPGIDTATKVLSIPAAANPESSVTPANEGAKLSVKPDLVTPIVSLAASANANPVVALPAVTIEVIHSVVTTPPSAIASAQLNARSAADDKSDPVEIEGAPNPAAAQSPFTLFANKINLDQKSSADEKIINDIINPCKKALFDANNPNSAIYANNDFMRNTMIGCMFKKLNAYIGHSTLGPKIIEIYSEFNQTCTLAASNEADKTNSNRSLPLG